MAEKDAEVRHLWKRHLKRLKQNFARARRQMPMRQMVYQVTLA